MILALPARISPMNDKVAIVIGVNGLHGENNVPPLRAAEDAIIFSGWMEHEGYEVHTFVDFAKKDEKVSIRRYQILDKIDECLQRGNVRQMIIFFAGHAINNGSDVWLLSDAKRDAGEAVSVQQTKVNAIQTRLKHLVIISDACRIVPTKLGDRFLDGITIIPPSDTIHTRGPTIDEFFAVPPGMSAIEKTVSTEKFAGIFSEALLRCFINTPTQYTIDVENPTSKALPNRKIGKLIFDEIYDAFDRRKLKKVIEPHISVPSDDHEYISRVLKGNEPFLQKVNDELVVIKMPESDSLFGIGDDDFGGLAGERKYSVPSDRNDANWTGHLAQSIELGLPITTPRRGKRRRYKTAGTMTQLAFQRAQKTTLANKAATELLFAKVQSQSDFVVTGAKFVQLNQFDLGGPIPQKVLRIEDGQTSAQLNSDLPSPSDSADILATFENGLGVYFAQYHGYRTELAFQNHGTEVRSLKYRPIYDNHFPIDFQIMALATSDAFHDQAMKLASLGRLSVASSPNFSMFDQIRSFKKFDPTLGVMIAYAYFDAGQYDEVASIANYMLYDLGGSIPFDIYALLRVVGRDDQVKAAHYENFSVNPRLPILTRGWQLARDNDFIGPKSSKSLNALKGYLKYSFWTTFSAEGVRLLVE
jgi:hypothetical protein